jgi:hypothetical protein
LGGILVACAAPAIVRASSLMVLPKPQRWEDFVREARKYDINFDRMITRLDIATANHQWSVDFYRTPGQPDMGREEAMMVLGNEIRRRGLRPSQLRKLSAPQSTIWMAT